MENRMNCFLQNPVERKTPPSPPTAGTGDGKQVVRLHGARPAAGVLRRHASRANLGFWVGAALAGTAGCILGACLPYERPLAVAVSVIWWGIYVGCLGASIGALLGLWSERIAVPQWQRIAAWIRVASREEETPRSAFELNQGQKEVIR
jgi:hypothetical protein